MKEFKAFSPAHITGFFEICDNNKEPLLKGSRGAGISLKKGVTTKVKINNTYCIQGKILESSESNVKRIDV